MNNSIFSYFIADVPDFGNQFLIYASIAIISWIIFYYTIKAAVKNGVKEANGEAPIIADTPLVKKDEQPKANPLLQKQVELQRKYEKGEITFEEYKKEWNI